MNMDNAPNRLYGLIDTAAEIVLAKPEPASEVGEVVAVNTLYALLVHGAEVEGSTVIVGAIVAYGAAALLIDRYSDYTQGSHGEAG